jgi:hypothetical protein
MKFDVTHDFDTNMATLEKALFDPRLYSLLSENLESVKKVELLELKDEGREVRRKVRYVPSTEIPSFARGKIKPEMLEWVEDTTYDRERHQFDYRILPNIPERWHDRFASRGIYRLTEMGGKVRRVIEGEVTIRVTLIGGMAERYVISQIKKNFDQEAEGLRAFLRQIAAEGK